jgi:hypothetical protein
VASKELTISASSPPAGKVVGPVVGEDCGVRVTGGVPVGEALGVAVAVAVSVGISVSVGVSVSVSVSVTVAVSVSTGVGVPVEVTISGLVAVALVVAVAVPVGEAVLDAVTVGVGDWVDGARVASLLLQATANTPVTTSAIRAKRKGPSRVGHKRWPANSMVDRGSSGMQLKTQKMSETPSRGGRYRPGARRSRSLAEAW